MKKSILLLSFICLFGCTKNDNEKSAFYSTDDRKYQINVYSAGHLIFTDTFTGLLHPNRYAGSTNAYYYVKGDSLIEFTGDYILKSIKPKQ